jgi:CheY-like chemotaxis protein
VETARPLLERSRSALTVDIPAAGLAVQADAARLSQVISNLLNNAAKFSPPGSRIQVRGWRDGSRACLSVQDEGCGIPDELQPRIFDPFVQASQGKDRALGGLGLGLSIAHSLVRLHHGDISVRSTGAGQGSQFLIDLPCFDGTMDDEASGAMARERSMRPRRVLLVDDNRDAAETLRSVLAAAGHDVLALFDAASAVRRAPGFAPDVAVLDIGLPVMDGHELALRLRELFAPDACPRFIALTGYGLKSDRERSATVGFSEHLLKPVDVGRLLEVIERE